MVTIIKKGISSETIKKLLEKFKSDKGFDAKKFCGIIKLKEDALSIQKSLRDEWS